MSVFVQTILAFDTAVSACSVAVVRGGKVLAHRRLVMNRGHAEVLMPMIAETLREAGTDLRDIDGLGVSIGPGSFTGLRAGLAAARGLAVARDLPLVGVNTFDAIAWSVPESVRTGRNIAVVIDTRRRDLYLRTYENPDTPLGEGQVVAAVDAVRWMPAGPLVIAGDGRRILLPLLREAGRDVVDGGGDFPDAGDIALIAAPRLAGSAVHPSPEPLYLREPEAVAPRMGGRLRP